MPGPTPHMQRAHAKLSPSSAYRWINCPGSVRASEGVDERTSAYAAEGTAAHELAAFCIENGEAPDQYLGSFIDLSDSAKRFHFNRPEHNRATVFEITAEMVEAVAIYRDHILSLVEAAAGVALIDVEQRLDMSHIHPLIFGTGDCVVYQVEEKHLHVCDFKYGRGVLVSPEENPQLFLYGAGAARRYHNHPLRKITLHVIQPRTPGEPIASWETDVLDLFDFEGDIAKAARATEAPDAPLVPGDWCDDGFCPVRATCETRRKHILARALAEFDEDGEVSFPDRAGLTAEQRGQILRSADQILGWVKAVQEQEHANALQGNPPTGFKLVAKRAIRKWKDEDQAKSSLLAADIAPDDLYEKKFVTPAKAEKLVGKKIFAAWEPDLVVKQSSGTNLVPVEDPRPAVAADALSEFSDVASVEN